MRTAATTAAFLATLPGRAAHRPVTAREPVSASAIRAWCDVMGERDPAFAGDGDVVAPPATLQMWTFPGLMPGRAADAGPAGPDDLDAQVRARLAADGLTATLATSTDQEFLADLRPGDLVTARDRYTEVSARKTTALGPGHFVSSVTTYTTQRGDTVGRLGLTVFQFRPHAADELADPAPAPRAVPVAGAPASAVSMRTGQALGAVQVPVTPTLVVAGALATRDVYPVHHDRDFARAHGNPDVLMNILTTNGLLARIVGEWSGGARLIRLVTRLRAPAYPHHTLTVDGSVVAAGAGAAELAVWAATEIGVHAEAVAHVRCHPA